MESCCWASPTIMKTINFDKFKKARFWIDELPDAMYCPSDMVAYKVPVNSQRYVDVQVAAIELLVPLGARSMYGLIGGSFEPNEGDGLSVEIYVSSSVERIFSESMAGLNDEVRVGLPVEYVRGVAAGVDVACAKLDSIAAGTLRLTCAAHGLIGSSEVIYKTITSALIGIFNFDGVDISDQDMIGLLSD